MKKFVLLLLCCVCTGCSSTDFDAPALLEESKVLQESMQVERERLTAELQAQVTALELAQAEANVQAAQHAEGNIERVQKALSLLDKVEAGVKQGTTVFEAMLAPDGTVNVAPAATTIATAVGGPIGTVIAIGLPLLWGAVERMRANKKGQQAVKFQRAAESIVKGIDKISIDDPELSARLDAVWSVAEGRMTDEAKQIVNDVAVT